MSGPEVKLKMKRKGRAGCYSRRKASRKSAVYSIDPIAGPSNSQSDDQSNLLAGRIESLHMENFMCHENLEVNFDKRITFITGKIGSGKTSIMAAVVVALGGSASATGCASTMADFIKKGETWARVTIKLNNSGTNSYKKDVYGNKITIVRTLSKTAATSYICQSEFGDIISNRKDEVDKIVTVLDLQIKNPICILNQDMATNFLSNIDSKARFSIFMKATHLENIKQIYTETLEMLTSSQQELADKRHAIAVVDTDINELKNRLEYLDNIPGHEEAKNDVKNEYHWSLVLEEEKALREASYRKKRAETNRTTITSTLVELEKNIVNMELRLGGLREKLKSDVNNHIYKKDELKRVEKESHSLQRQMDGINLRLNHLIWRSERQSIEMDNIQKHLDNSEELARQVELKEERQAERQKLMIELSDLRDRLQSNLRDHYNAIQSKLQYNITLETLIHDLTGTEKFNTHHVIQMNKRGSEENCKNKYYSYAPEILKLSEEAAMKNQYQKKPVGPCGLYVTLSDKKKWARPVEHVVGSLMNAYCCDNEKDFKVLSQIMDKVCGGKNPPIIINKFKDTRYNVDARKVSVPGLNAVVDVLNISNNVVFNMFVDQARIEKVLLFETDAQAASMLTNIHTVPRNFSMGLTPQGNIYYPAPNYRTYSVDEKRVLKYFDNAECEMSRTECSEQYESNVTAIAEKNKKIEEISSNLAKTEEFLKKYAESMHLLKQREREIIDRISQLDIEDEGCPVAQTKYVLEDELAALQKGHAELEEKIQEEKTNLVMFERNKQEKDKLVDAVKVQEAEMMSDLINLEDTIKELNFKISEDRSKRAILSLRKKDAEFELEAYNSRVMKRQEMLKQKLSVVTGVNGKRVEIKKTSKELHLLLKHSEAYLIAMKAKLECREPLIEEIEDKGKKYSKMVETAGVLNRVVQSLSKLVVAKKEKLNLLQSRAATLVSFHFQAALRTRGYDGNLIFDFVNQTLDMEVGPKDDLKRTDTKTLSGGERSFAMTSFILAIWRTVQMPFYFLESDVFVDKANRKAIMDLLLEYAKFQKKMQFIFITPQDISNIQPSDVVSIFKMPDPRI